MTHAPIALVAIAYALASAVATLAYAEFMPRTDDTKIRGGYSAHAACALAAAVVGGAVAARAGSLETLAVTALAVMALVIAAYAGFCSDGTPIAIPAAALGIVLIASVMHGLRWPLIAAAVTGLPFAITALMTPDKRSSLRDAAVAAVGGAILGVQFGILTTISGALIAVLIFKLAATQFATRSFAPFIASTIGCAMVIFSLLSV